MNWSLIAGLMLVVFLLIIIVMEAYCRWSCLWFYCRRCGCFWHLQSKERRTNQPEEIEGVCRERSCPWCDSKP